MAIQTMNDIVAKFTEIIGDAISEICKKDHKTVIFYNKYHQKIEIICGDEDWKISVKPTSGRKFHYRGNDIRIALASCEATIKIHGRIKANIDRLELIYSENGDILPPDALILIAEKITRLMGIIRN